MDGFAVAAADTADFWHGRDNVVAPPFPMISSFAFPTPIVHGPGAVWNCTMNVVVPPVSVRVEG